MKLKTCYPVDKHANDIGHDDISMREIRVATAIALGTATAAGSYMWWRWLEFARRKKFVRGSSKLPSPMPALPNWFGFVGGHTLVFKLGHVSTAAVLVYMDCVDMNVVGKCHLSC